MEWKMSYRKSLPIAALLTSTVFGATPADDQRHANDRTLLVLTPMGF